MTTKEVIAQFENHRCQPKPSGKDAWRAKCPAHDDHNPSLFISKGRHGETILKCFAGCDFKDIVAAAGMKPKDLFAERRAKSGAGRIIAEYNYRDENGELLFQVVRFEPKSFRQRRRGEDGSWSWKLNGVLRVLFRLPEILAAIKANKTVFIAEGEKDVQAMVKNGFEATCNPGGAGKWRDDYSNSLAGANVVIIADNDEPGRKHAELVAGHLRGKAKRVRVVELPDTNGKPVKDAHDFFAAGGTAQDLLILVAETHDWEGSERHHPQTSPNIETVEGNETESIRGKIIYWLRCDEPAATQRDEITKAVIKALCDVGRFYFHLELRDFNSAMFFHTKRRQLERIQSDSFLAWLSMWLGINRADTIFKFIKTAVETEALSGQNTTGILPEAFWASRPGAIYLSCGDGGIVKITAKGFAAVDNGTDGVLFAAGQTLAPWNYNASPASILGSTKLFRDSQCAADHGRDLFTLWLYSLSFNPRCKPPLVLSGDIGSGKTRLAKGISELLGIPFIAAKVEDDREGDFWPSMDQGGIFTLDNADTRCRWLADAVSNATTDGCSRRRKLYTNSETVLLRARAWLIITTANPTFANDAGLADRLLLVRMNRRIGSTSDEALSQEIAVNRDAGLAHVAHTLSAALADTAATPSGLNQRHPDFAAFAVRIGRALGREPQIIAALSSAEADKSIYCVENDNIGAALLTYLRGVQLFEGTAAELGPILTSIDPELDGRVGPKRLGKRLNSLWPHLVNVCKASKEGDRNGVTVYRLEAFCGVCGVSNADSHKLPASPSREDFLGTCPGNPANPALEPIQEEVLL